MSETPLRRRSPRHHKQEMSQPDGNVVGGGGRNRNKRKLFHQDSTVEAHNAMSMECDDESVKEVEEEEEEDIEEDDGEEEFCPENKGSDDDSMDVASDFNEEEDSDAKIGATKLCTPRKSSRKTSSSAAIITPSPAASKRASRTSKNKTKAKSQAKTNRPVARKSDNNSKSKPRTIAFRGLPRGALAKCPQTGLTIRSMESLPPLHAPVAHLHASTVTLPSPPQQNEEDSTTTTPLLPIKFMLASPNSIVPDDWTGRTFASASTFYETFAVEKIPAVPSLLKIDYNMEVVADPVFAPWEFVQARLDSSGLLNCEMGTSEKDPGPMLYVVEIEWDGNCKVSGRVLWYQDYVTAKSKGTSGLVWGIVEASQRETPSVLIGAPPSLVEHVDSKIVMDVSDSEKKNDAESTVLGSGKDLVAPISPKAAQIQLPASLLQKSIRRGKGLCSESPLLESCATLLLPKKHGEKLKPPPAGSTFAMLKTVWGCMLVDASPFEDADNCLGLPSLLLLSLIAKADPTWLMPPSLCRAAVVGALRTAQSAPSQPWLGFVERQNNWWELERSDMAPEATDLDATAACNLRNILRAAQTSIGGRIAWGKWSSFVGDQSAAALLSYLNDSKWKGSYLGPAPQPRPNEIPSIQRWECQNLPVLSANADTRHLDSECRLAAYEPTWLPATLVVLQALISKPPTSWKKHALPCLSKQVRKLITEVNPRIQERVQLARLATWGKAVRSVENSNTEDIMTKHYRSFREAVTLTGTLSEQETEVVNCFEAIQEWINDRPSFIDLLDRGSSESSTGAVVSVPLESNATTPRYIQVKAGPPLTDFDGRVAFILAFATSMEIEVVPDPQDPSSKEIVSAMFCGDTTEPLLVQRIGKARKEGREAASAGGAKSGAAAVPSLGYIQRSRSSEEERLMHAAEIAVAKLWKGGKASPLPLPPVGLQWDLPGSTVGWEGKEASVERTAELIEDDKGKKSWRFTVAGVEVQAFDARAVVSSCALDLDDVSHRPEKFEPGSERDRLLRLAMYVKDDDNERMTHGKPIIGSLSGLHNLAESDRVDQPHGLSEGRVYDWLHYARYSLLPSRVWRDALLAVRTRENDFVVLGKGIGSDGTGAPRDMVEGVLLRIFHCLEMLYPQALRKVGALKFAVRPRGASFYHLLMCLELLGRGEGLSKPTGIETRMTSFSEVVGMSPPAPDTQGSASNDIQSQKRPRRVAAVAAAKRARIVIENEQPDTRKVERPERDDEFTLGHSVSTTDPQDEMDSKTNLPLPTIKTNLWPHQKESVEAVVEGVRIGKRGHADASAVGAGKTLTALATIVRLARWVETSGRSRHGVLVMLPTKALIREWLLEIAAHTDGFHVIEQREDGSLFSLTYGKTHPPIDGNALIITTLDRVANHPFVRQSAWDFVVIDECLSVQNAAAKRNPSAWRQIEVSICGVLLLSATFFRSKFDQLFYMIRMLRSPLPRTLEWLPATIHEHIVCQVPESDRSWTMRAEMVSLPGPDLRKYRDRIDAFRRKQINEPRDVDGRKLWVDLESMLRAKYEGRDSRSSYIQSSPMGNAFAKVAQRLLTQGRRPLIFADTSQEQEFLMRTLLGHGIDAQTWANLATRQVSSSGELGRRRHNKVIVAVKTVEGQGINMQHHADTILCRPTPGDHLEQMKGRVDRPGQTTKDLLLCVVVCQHTIEEAKYANIRLAGNFFREYIAPVATRYKERIDLEAALAACGTKKLKSGTVSGAWRRELEMAGQSGAFASFDDSAETGISATTSYGSDADEMDEDACDSKPRATKPKKKRAEPKYKPLNKVIRNKGDPKAVRQAKDLARNGGVSPAVRCWLFPTKTQQSARREKGGLAKTSLMRFSDTTPPVVLDQETIHKAVTHLSNNDPKLAALIARVGVEALVGDCGAPKKPTQALFFDRCLRSITFTMVSLDAGNAFLRRLAIKIGACLENKEEAVRVQLVARLFGSTREGGNCPSMESPDKLLELLLRGKHDEVLFTHEMLRELVNDCEVLEERQSGYPHICGVTHPCGKNDDHNVFIAKAKAHAKQCGPPVSAGFSREKARFIISLVEDFENNKISGEKIAQASDREAAKMLLELKGIGDWCAGGILMQFLGRADIMLFGDLTVRNYLNDLYDINHLRASETLLESAADFDDTGPNRNLIDKIAEEKKWSPYRSVVCYLCYHLQEENLVLL